MLNHVFPKCCKHTKSDNEDHHEAFSPGSDFHWIASYVCTMSTFSMQYIVDVELWHKYLIDLYRVLKNLVKFYAFLKPKFSFLHSMEPTPESLRDHHAIIWNRLAISWCGWSGGNACCTWNAQQTVFGCTTKRFFQNQEELCFPENKQNLAESVGYFWRYTDLHAYIYILFTYTYCMLYIDMFVGYLIANHPSFVDSDTCFLFPLSPRGSVRYQKWVSEVNFDECLAGSIHSVNLFSTFLSRFLEASVKLDSADAQLHATFDWKSNDDDDDDDGDEWRWRRWWSWWRWLDRAQLWLT